MNRPHALQHDLVYLEADAAAPKSIIENPWKLNWRDRRKLDGRRKKRTIRKISRLFRMTGIQNAGYVTSIGQPLN
jgi:hypothetical protein